MVARDLEDTIYSKSVLSVDGLNSAFYSRFPYPWPPMKFEYVLDPYFETTMLNQTLGEWHHSIFPDQPKIWTAGCGTNQAIFTGLRFPKSNILGSDISRGSLNTCADIAQQVGVRGLELKNESINEVGYREQFDFIICTGVIHHNADPQATLKKLANALKPNGVLELMVYNLYHQLKTTSSRKAIRILHGHTKWDDLDTELRMVKAMIKKIPHITVISDLFPDCEDCPEAILTDKLLQPVEYSYTVESLELMAKSCGLEIVTPCINIYDKTKNTFSWNMIFDDLDLLNQYHSLSDTRRWQVTNLLLQEQSPMLWFYLQRSDCDRCRKTEPQICEEFLDTVYVKTKTIQKFFIRGDDKRYRLSPESNSFPSAFPDSSTKEILEVVDGKSSMREIFQRLGKEIRFDIVNEARLRLTTSAFPYLRAIASGEMSLS